MEHPFSGNIIPIRIPTPFLVGDVFAYLVKDEKLVLIDTGQHNDEAYKTLRLKLKNEGFSVSDLDEIWITHGHPDHFGQAARLRDVSGATVLAPEGEKANLENISNRRLYNGFFSNLGVEKPVVQAMAEQLSRIAQFQLALKPDRWIFEGDLLETGRFTFRIKHLPGHAPGHIAYCEDNFTFGGDVLLSHISTNALISFDPGTGERNRSFLQYRESLKWIKHHGNAFFPGHGKFIPRSKNLAEMYLEEQEQRMNHILSVTNKEPFSITELSRKLFPEAWNQKVYFLVLSETQGFLDWGIERNLFSEIREDGKLLFLKKPET